LGFRLALFPLFVLANLAAVVALWRAAATLLPPVWRLRARAGVGIVVVVLNLPLLIFFFPSSDAWLHHIPSPMLRIFFYPATAWLATILAFVIVVTIIGLPVGMVRAIRLLFSRFQEGSRAKGSAGLDEQKSRYALSRRRLVTSAPALLIPGLYGVATYGTYSALGEIDISPERSIPIPNLASSMDGLTIVQLSDIHVGPYLREKELQHIVSLTNELRPDVVVITGDVLDRSLSSLPDALNGLRGLRASLGIFAVLGNHDYYADRYSYSAQYRGAVHITKGLESIGIPTLRNQVVHLGSGSGRIALLGLDWLTASDRNFFSYKPVETRRQLARMMRESEPDTPRVLLAHHPDTFQDVPPEIGLTLSGHTHGGGQVILGSVGGVPIGVATLRFKYLSGLYQRNGQTLYVNRGIGYLGVPIRINCPPEISRFKLVRPA
jgi:predicted MPP superfamily phosphohydrolase